MTEITQEENSRIIRKGKRFKNDELPEDVLSDFFFYHIRTHTSVNFMNYIEEHRGVRMRAPRKCRQKKPWH